MNSTATVKKLTVADLKTVKGAQDSDATGVTIELGKRVRIVLD